ncbi:MAG: hypothetical protein DRQ89_14410 [Epsilonproteobacteria bacterium]|nr:MAG: hypothetical protein DRQ89_14410 [Campylobacterota bacterium]
MEEWTKRDLIRAHGVDCDCQRCLEMRDAQEEITALRERVEQLSAKKGHCQRRLGDALDRVRELETLLTVAADDADCYCGDPELAPCWTCRARSLLAPPVSAEAGNAHDSRCGCLKCTTAHPTPKDGEPR